MTAGIDLIIVILYLALLLVAGVFFSRKAGGDIDEYFLGGRKLPWWVLGASGMSSNLDVAGTMTLVAMLATFGLHGFFIEFRGGVVLPIAVFLAFMGKWHRRSGVMTTAEWMKLRFGDGWPGRMARLTAALTYLIITVGMVVFFLSAAGKFLSAFLPLDERSCQFLMLGVAVTYTMLSGLYGVVWTDVIQSVLVLFAAVYVAVLATGIYSPAIEAAWEGARFNSVLPFLHHEGLVAGGTDYSIFGLFLVFWAGKGLLEGLGGSGGSAYMAQRYYAASSPRDCIKLSMLWVMLFAVRWPLVLGFVILAIAQGLPLDQPESLLPRLLASDLFPPGVRGLLIAALLAAAMSTFDSTINAGASYFVNDLYRPLRGGRAGRRELVIAGYAASLLIVGTGLVIAGSVTSVVDIWVTIVINLFPAFLVPFALRWFWHRFNGIGFSVGVGVGFLAAFSTQVANPWGIVLSEFLSLAIIAGTSLMASVLATLLSRPTPTNILRAFYRQTRPFGIWPQDWLEPDRREHRGDRLRLLAALAWQISTFLLPMALMLRLWPSLPGLLVIWIASLAWLLHDLKRQPE